METSKTLHSLLLQLLNSIIQCDTGSEGLSEVRVKKDALSMLKSQKMFVLWI